MATTDITLYITDSNGKNGRSLIRYQSFSFSSNVDAVTDTFTISLIDPDFAIKVGYYIYFDIRRELVLRGLVQKITRTVSKGTTIVNISGKSATLLLVEQFCRNLNDFSFKTPKFIVDSLIDQTDFISRQNELPLIFFESNADSDTDQEEFETTAFIDIQNQTFTRSNQVVYDPDFEALGNYREFTINAGDTVYNKISEIVTINGFQVYFKPIGDLYVGKLKTERDAAGVNFNITHRRNDISNNVLSAELSEDISNRYSEIQVMTQLENGTNVTRKIIDQTAPLQKLMVMSVSNDQDPLQIGLETRELQRTEGYTVTYTVSGFTQNQRLWAVNRLVRVDDELLDIKQNLVIYNRVFTFDLNEGAKTELILSVERNLVDRIFPPGTVSGVTVEGS